MRITFPFHENALVSSLIQKASSLTSSVVMRCIGNVKPSHKFTEIGKRYF